MLHMFLIYFSFHVHEMTTLNKNCSIPLCHLMIVQLKYIVFMKLIPVKPRNLGNNSELWNLAVECKYCMKFKSCIKIYQRWPEFRFCLQSSLRFA